MDWPDDVTDITIAGGGIIGLTTAYVLSQRAEATDKTVSIRVLEQQDGFGNGSTTRAGCGLRTFYRTQVNRELAQDGLRFWENASSLLGTDIGFRRAGYLFLTNQSETAAALRRQAAEQRSVGEPASYGDSPESFPVSDALNASAYTSGVHTPNAALATPTKMVEALVNRTQQETVTLHSSTPVVDLTDNGNGVTVETGNQTIETDYVVNATGGWANQLAQMIGETLPITLQARRLARLDVMTDGELPLAVDLDTGVYVLPDEDGTLLAGGKFGEVTVDSPTQQEAFDRSIDEAWNDALAEAGSQLHTRIGEASVTESWTGLYAMTHSRRPIIEHSGRIIHATGFSGHGIMQAPGAATVVADAICNTSLSRVSTAVLQRGRAPVEPDLQF